MKTKYFLLFVLLSTILCLQTVSALRNPAADYCGAMGYEYTTRMTPDGEEGICKLPNGQEVEEWAFLQGKVAPEFSYCAEQGYEQKITNDPKKCMPFMTDTCVVCIINGEEVEVTELMDLDFSETTCGDGQCGFPETINDCPQDCEMQQILEMPPVYEQIVVVQRERIPPIVWFVGGIALLIIVLLWFFRKKK
jgi:putative hemolysin